jgi:hypothetical protein
MIAQSSADGHRRARHPGRNTYNSDRQDIGQTVLMKSARSPNVGCLRPSIRLPFVQACICTCVRRPWWSFDRLSCTTVPARPPTWPAVVTDSIPSSSEHHSSGGRFVPYSCLGLPSHACVHPSATRLPTLPASPSRALVSQLASSVRSTVLH